MKIQCLIGVVGILVLKTACIQAVERPEQEENDNSLGGAKSYPVLAVSNASSHNQEPNSNSWNCGTEWIMLKDPDGNYFYIEIYKNCDPLQDIYKGCPSPLDN